MARGKVPESAPDLMALSFEAAFKLLSEVVDSLEGGGLPLAQTTGLYERGKALAQRCNQLLNDAQLTITQLKESYAAPLDEEVLDWDEETEP